MFLNSIRNNKLILLMIQLPCLFFLVLDGNCVLKKSGWRSHIKYHLTYSFSTSMAADEIQYPSVAKQIEIPLSRVSRKRNN